MPRIAYESPQLRRDFRRASRQTQAKIEEFVRKFDEDATRGGLRVKSPESPADSRVKVARVDQALRAVLIDIGDQEYVLVRVMEHDAAYEWARTLRPDVSSFDGRPRLLNLEVAEVSESAATPERAGPLGHRSDTDFDEVGVPPFMFSVLRAMTARREVEQFADWASETDPLLGFAILGLLDADRSVEEVLQELVALEGGPEEETPRADGVLNGVTDSVPQRPTFDTEDLRAAMTRPGAEERFRLVDDSVELAAALQGDFADWQVFLHPLQRKAAYSTNFSGPARVSGGAGTGKTVVLIHRVKALLDRAGSDHDAPRILLTTLTSHLERDLTVLLRQLVGKERADLVAIRTVDGLARDLHRQMSGAATHELSEDEEVAAWSEVRAALSIPRSALFLRNEYRHVVLARGVRTLDEYLVVARTGRGIRLSAEGRRALWPAFEAFEARTRQAGRFSRLQLTEAVAALVEQLPSRLFDHVLVDEAQDLDACQWRLIRAITVDGPDDLFIAGDAFQRIYGNSVSLRALGIETRGRSLRLRRNYRTTHEIVGWALGLIGDEAVVDLDELGADLVGYHSVRHGPRPTFRGCPDRAAELVQIVDTVRRWQERGHHHEDIAVLGRSATDLTDIIQALQAAEVPVGKMGRNGRIGEVVNVATMHRVKGLEFPCVAVSGLTADRVPPPGAVCSVTEDPQQHASDLQRERSLVYVAATRARDELLVTWHGEAATIVAEQVSDPLGVGTTETAA